MNPVSIGHALSGLVSAMRGFGIDHDVAVREFRKRWIVQELEACNYNQCQAAAHLGVHRNTLNHWMIELKIERPREGRGRKQLAGEPAGTRPGSLVNSVRKGGRGESPELAWEKNRSSSTSSRAIPPASSSSNMLAHSGSVAGGNNLCGRLTEGEP